MSSRVSAFFPAYRALFVVLATLMMTIAPLPASAASGASPHLRAPWHWGRQPIVVGYFPGWSARTPQPYTAKSLIVSGAAARINQLNYAQGSVKGGRCSLADPVGELQLTFRAEQSVNGRADDPKSTFRGTFHQLEELKRRYPHLKILVSLEGNAEDFANGSLPEHRRAFVASCVDTFVRGRFAPGVMRPGIFDGIDIDWESPEAKDAANFMALLKEFRSQMDAVRPGLRLSVAVGDTPQMLPGTDFAAVARIVDQVGVMNYDYAGPWNTKTGFVAPLFSSTDAPRDYSSIEHSIAAYKAAGVPVRKLLMGLPFYGYSWTRVEEATHGLFQEGDGVRDDAPYHQIVALSEPFESSRDPRS